MINKVDIIIKIQNELNNIFVDDYDSIKNALIDINSYLNVMDIPFQYDYTVFCKEFLSVTQKFVDKMTVKELTIIEPYTLTQEIIAIMIYQKIGESIDNEGDKKFKLLQHILIKKNN